MIKKLEKYGVKDNQLKWFRSYITNRKQRIQCNSKLSGYQNLTIGIPQGSALGPTLFLIFINDISEYIKNGTCNIFADDVVIYVNAKNTDEVNRRLQDNLNEVNKWYLKNRLRINVEKTKVLLLKSKDFNELDITIDGRKVEQVKSMKYLGLTIDDELKWNIHINNMCKSIAYKTHFLNKMRKYLNPKLLNTIYKSSIQPCYDYACSVWGNCSDTLKNKLLRLQKRAARIVTNNFEYENTSGTELMKSLSWPSIEQRRDYFLATLMYKCIYGLAPSRLCNEVEMVFDRHGYTTRYADSLNVILPKPNSETFKQSFKYAGAKVWNKLPNILQNSKSVNIFKLNYKKQHLHSSD